MNALFSEYKREILGQDIEDGIKYDVKGDYPHWIISDTRFLTEAKSIKERGGIIIQVNRFNLKLDENNNCMCNSGDICPNGKTKYGRCCRKSELERYFHLSETELDNYDFDYIIENKGTKEELLEEVRKMLKKYNII